MKRISVCVTAVGGGGFGEQILKALRLAKTPYHITGTDAQIACTGFSFCDAAVVLPFANDPEYLPRILELCRDRQVSALLPGSEAELLVLSVNRHLLLAENIFFPFCEHALLELCLDKSAMFAALAAKGADVPWFRRVSRWEDLGGSPGYPLVFKPSRGGGGSVNTFVVQDEEEAQLFCTYLLRTYGDFLAQEYVGTPEEEYTVGVLTDMDGVLIHSIALRRTLRSALSRRACAPNRTSRSDLGPSLAISSGISQGVTGTWPEVCAPCEDIAALLGARGPFNLQCRLADGRMRLFEINPRFSGTTSIRAMAGLNEPDLLIRRHVLGEGVPRRPPVLEHTILRRLEEVMVDN